MAENIDMQAAEPEEIKEENLFVFRLISAECTYGSMAHPLNVEEIAGGHGVVYGVEELPLLNANDWVPDVNVIHFGDCCPKEPEEQVTEEKSYDNVLEFLWNKGNEIRDKIKEDIKDFVMTGKCKPIIETVWYDTDKRFLIDGAPVMVVRSMLFCKRGGVITITWEAQEEEADAQAQTDDETQTAQDAIEEAKAEVNASVDQALAEGKIDQATADYMKQGYEAALIFANGDIEEANQLFNDLVRYGNSPAFGMDPAVDYENSGALNEKFILYLKHTRSPLLSDCNSTMNMTSTASQEQVNLRDAVQAVASNNKRVADTVTDADMDAAAKQELSTMSGYLEQLRAEEKQKFTFTDEYGMEYSAPLPERLTNEADPSEPFSFLLEGNIPHWYENSKMTETTVRIIDQAAGNPDTPVVISILNGL